MAGEIIAISVIVLIIGCAAAYIIKAKKSGKKCIGCTHADSCPSRGSCQPSIDDEKSDADSEK